jgi:hypothetical protein
MSFRGKASFRDRQWHCPDDGNDAIAASSSGRWPDMRKVGKKGGASGIAAP